MNLVRGIHQLTLIQTMLNCHHVDLRQVQVIVCMVGSRTVSLLLSKLDYLNADL